VGPRVLVGAALRHHRPGELDFPPTRLSRVGEWSLGRGSGRAQLGLKLRDAALEEDDRLERAPEDPRRVDHLADALDLRSVRHSPAVACCPPAAQAGARPDPAILNR